MNIKEIALKVAGDFMKDAIGKQNIIEFAEALLAEVQKQNEPVAWWNGKETAFFEHETDGPVGEVKIPLYTFPPSIEPQWKSIESAPNDVTEILLYSEPYGVDVAYLHNGKWRTSAGQCDIEYPTHWLPLPEAPSEGGK